MSKVRILIGAFLCTLLVSVSLFVVSVQVETTALCEQGQHNRQAISDVVDVFLQSAHPTNATERREIVAFRAKVQAKLGPHKEC